MRGVTLALAACAALPGVEFTFGSLGGSPVPIGAGARALGMGGAFSAIADDATAATWNPAGMAQVERPEVSLSGGYYWLDAETGSNDDLYLDHIGGVLPFYALGFQQAVGLAWQRRFDLTVGIDYASEGGASGIFTASGSSVAYQREGSYAAWSIGYAIAAGDTVNVGFSIEVWNDELSAASDSDARYRNVTTLETSTLRLITERDQRIDERVDSGHSFNIGGQWRAVPQLTLSLVLKPGFDLEIEQQLRNRELSRTIQKSDGSVVDSSSDASTERNRYDFEYPTSATIGAGWRPNDRQIATIDLTWTRWSEFAVTRAGERVSAFSDRLEPEAVDDDLSIRIGYEHVVILPRWVLAGRCGLLYERLPGLEPVRDLNDPGEAEATTEDWFGGTLGLSAYRRQWAYDAALQLRGAEDVGAGVYAPPDEQTDVLSLTFRAGVGFLF